MTPISLFNYGIHDLHLFIYAQQLWSIAVQSLTSQNTETVVSNNKNSLNT